MKNGLEDLENGSKRYEGEDYRSKAFVPTSKGYSAHYQIIVGYNEAVTVLFNEIKDKRGSVDSLFYPMFFCARHSIELQFKLLIGMVNDFNNYRNNKCDTIKIKGHNLKILSDKLNDLISSSDRRIRDNYKKVDVESLLSFFDAKDSTSQSFRYLHDKDGNRLLDSSFNILKPLEEYKNLFNLLEWIEEVIDELRKEYETKTYTYKLSRNDLELIAKRLPDKKEWGSQVFLDERERIKQDFNLSSNSDFNKALGVIKANPYLCSLVGMEIPEEGFSDEFYLLYKEMKDTEIKIESRSDELSCKNQGFPSIIISLEELYSDKTVSDYNSLLEGYVSRLTDNDCILYNTYRSIRKYCEEYEEQKMIFSIKLSSSSLREYTCGKMSSTGFLRFEEGLQLCGRTTVLKKLGIPLKNCIDRSDFVC